jgi:murein DD-endopeptidase MepM/ murein hydrolase activator NlpD
MSRRRGIVVILGSLLLLLAGAGCSVAGVASSNASTQAAPSSIPPTPPSPTQTMPAATSLPATLTPANTPTLPPPSLTPSPPTPVVITPCAEDVCVLPFAFPFARPIAPPGRINVDGSYRFGTDAQGERDVHHGVEFLNSQGTPVLAAADGVVVFAADDKKTIYGLYYYFYGNFVVLQHAVPGFEQPVYTLYAHLSKIDVQVDDALKTGDKLGEVGGTGAATGSHLHFEVRFGENTYPASRNPELWLQPLPDENGQPGGALAGRVIDTQGGYAEIPNIVIERISGGGLSAPGVYYLNTYAETKLVGQDPWQESFGVGDLPAGEYRISFAYRGMQQRVVQVLAGQLTLVTFRVPD